MPATHELTRRQRYEQTRAALRLERSSFDAHWAELAEFLTPRRTQFTLSDRNRGDKRNSSIIDSAPRYALRTLQSGMHAGMTSPARPWMKLTTPDPDLAEFEPVRVWLHAVTQRLLTVFLRSNLYNALPTLYGDLGGFGTGCMAALEDVSDLLRCYTFPIGSYAVGMDARGLPAVFTYEYRYTVRQLIEEFGVEPGQRAIDWTKFSTTVKNLWDEGQHEQTVDVCWYIGPNDQYDARRLDAKYMKFRSCHYEMGREDRDIQGTGFLREKGFNEFPLFVPRWDVTSTLDTYGTDCPGMTALGDVKQLQLMQRRKAQAIEKGLNPALSGPANLRSEKVSSLPGALTYIDVREGMQGLKPLYEVDPRFVQFMVADMAETRQRCREAFFADLFLMLANSDQVQPVTAEEIRARQEEKLIALGPVLERTNDELLDPLVDRAFAMLLRAGAIPPPPDELQGLALRVEYLSVMAQAQKLIGVVGQDRFLQSTLAMAEVFPEVTAKVNALQVIDRYGDMLGVDPNIVRTDEEAEAILQQRAEAQAAAAEAEQAKTMGQAAQSLANAPLPDGRTALSAVIDGVGA